MDGQTSMNCGMEPIRREQTIAKYLARTLGPDAVEEFEAHYLACDECFDELRVSDSLAAGLRASYLAWTKSDGVAVVAFRAPAQLTHAARELEELRRSVLEQSDTRVLIDLSGVTRIDSAGLGQLMSCYSHLVRNHGSLKVVNARPEVKKVLDMTGISSLIPAFSDEREAVESFKN